MKPGGVCDESSVTYYTGWGKNNFLKKMKVKVMDHATANNFDDFVRKRLWINEKILRKNWGVW